VRSFLNLIVFSCVLGAGCATVGARPADKSRPSWKPAVHFSRVDRQAILELARAVGFSDVDRVSAVAMLPSGGFYVDARTPVSASGNKRTWSSLHLCEVGSASGCEAEAGGAALIRVGRWTTSAANISAKERWRIHDAEWQVELALGPGIEYDDAAQIVLAIRRKTLINRLWENNEFMRRFLGNAPDVDAKEIGLIKKCRLPDDGFEVHIGIYSGYVFYVRVIDGRVELFRYSTWIT
jgi:hypothetical protein